MHDQRPLEFFHAPNSRSSGVLALPEQVAVYPYLADLYRTRVSRRSSTTRCADLTCAGLRTTAPSWTTGFGLVPSSPVIERYLQAVQSRPAMIRARARDTELAAAHA